MTAISSWKKKLKKVKGLTKQQLQILSTLPTPVLTSLINQVGMIVSGNDVEESTKAYGDSLRKIARDRQLKNISKKDKQTLLKIADLLAKANEDVDEASSGGVAGFAAPLHYDPESGRRMKKMYSRHYKTVGPDLKPKP